MYIDDCVKGIDRITHTDALIAAPINLGTSELVTVNELVSIIERIGGVKIKRDYDPAAPQGVHGRNSDNTLIKKVLGWEPDTPLRTGLAATYAWIKEQFEARKAGRHYVL
jgi:GDP-D-mannose 3',5'-epimerase